MTRWDRTHKALKQTALSLCAERGYDATTTAYIAEQAGVSEMTLFRHFPTKESLLLTDPFDPVMADAVRSRPAHERPVTALVAGVRQTWNEVDAASIHDLTILLRIIANTPTLQGALERNTDETVRALIDALRDRGTRATQAAVAARAVIAGLSTALIEWAKGGSGEQGSLHAAVASALTVLDGR